MSATDQVEAAVVDEAPLSPDPKSKAQRGAELAAEAARNAFLLQNRTRDDIAASQLQDLKLPCVPVSPSSYDVEYHRTLPADSVQGSRWCGGPARVLRPTAFGCPATADDETLQGLIQTGLTTLSLRDRPVSMNDAVTLSTLLGRGSRFESLQLRRAMTATETPAIPEDMLGATKADVAAEFPPPEDEEDVEATEKLQAAVEKLKGEFTGEYNEAIEFIARRRLDRTATLVNALIANTSLTDVDMSCNGWGAPAGEEGQASYRQLRQVARLLDLNTTLGTIDLSGNGMGPAGAGIVAKAMCKNISVHTLDLSGNEIINEAPEEEDDPDQEEEDPVFGDMMQGLEALSEMLKKNKFLRTLSLANNRIQAEIEEDAEEYEPEDTSFGKFLEPFKKYHRLSVLDLSGNELGPAGARMVADALIQNQSVTVLDISDNNIGPKGLGHLARLVGNNRVLTTLHLQKNDCGGKKGKRAQKEALKYVTEFATALGDNDRIVDLNASANHFGPDLSDALMDGIVKAPNLATLTFESNFMCALHPDPSEYDGRALNKLVGRLSDPEQRITTVDIAGNNLLAEGCRALAASNDTLRGVVSFNVSRNAIGDEGCEALCVHLRDAVANTSITELDISHNSIVNGAPLALSLRTTTSLRRVNVSHNLLGTDAGDGVQALLDAISGRPLVERLNLASNKLNSMHALQIASFCKLATPPFEGLDIFDNPNITITDATKIVSALRNNRCIKSLRISAQQGDCTALVDAIAATLEVNGFVADLDCCLPADCVDEVTGPIRSRLLVNSLSTEDPHSPLRR